MARKRIKVSRRMLFTWLMLAGFILLLSPQSWTNKFQIAFTRIFSLPLSISRSVSLLARTKKLRSDLISRNEYNQLQNHLANLTEQLNQQRRKVKKLSGLRDRTPFQGAKFVLADVITASFSGLKSELILNRGQDDGLAVDQFVLGDNSIIGAISVVSSRTAQVRLITDLASNIPVKIAELDVSRVMQGHGNDSAKIRFLSRKHKVKIGDNVYACKKPGLLDTPMITARVDKCERADDNPSIWDITVKPVCDIKAIDNVAVLIMNPKK